MPDFPEYLQLAMDAAAPPTPADVQRAAQANGLDVDQNLVSRWLRGEMKQAPTVAKLRPVADVLGIPLNEMMVGAGLVSPAEVGLDRPPRPPMTLEQRMRADKRLTPGKAEIMIRLLHEFQEEHSPRTGVRTRRHANQADQGIDTGGDEELSS